jgi:capsular exopolysaccharide synthesis family protein
MVVSMPERQTPELREYLAVLWHRKWYVAMVAVVVVVTALFYSLQQTPMYQSTAEVLVRPVNFSPTQPSTAGGFLNMNTEIRVASSNEVGAIVAERLREAGVAATGIAVEAPANTETLLFTATSPDPFAAQATAQAYAESYLEFRREEVLEDLRAASQPIEDRIEELNVQLEEVQRDLFETTSESERTALQIRLNSLLTQRAALEEKRNELILPENLRVGEVLQFAQLPAAPSSPDHNRTASFALFVGLALGLGVAFLRDRLDQRIRNRDDLQARIGVPVLGVVPQVRSGRRHRILGAITLSQPNSEIAEAYRTLRTSLLFSASQQGWKTLMVTSSKPREGKTAAVANLGVSLEQAGKRVIVVSADLRRPRLHQYLFVRNQVGLTDILSGDREAFAALNQVGIGNLQLLDTGPLPGNPAELLGSDAMRRLLAQLREDADFIVVDAAPVLGVSDAMALVPLVDAVLFIADGKRATRGEISESRYQLEQVGAPLIGAVLTNYDRSRYRAYQGHYDGSSRIEPQPAATVKMGGNGHMARIGRRRAERSRAVQERRAQNP